MLAMMKLIVSFVFTLVVPLEAIVWRADLEEAPREARDEMKQVGKVYFSPLKVFGASCLAMGGDWVLTCRHGTDKWSGVGMTVSFPALGKNSYKVEKVVFPEKGDFALLKLEKKVSKAKAVNFFEGEAKEGQRVWIGGFGLAGPVGKVKGGGAFHVGHNKVDGLRGGKISISLSKPEDDSAEKDEAMLSLFDSGSPLFLETKDGWRLAGVASTASNGKNPGYGDRGNYAQVVSVQEWLKTTMGEK